MREIDVLCTLLIVGTFVYLLEPVVLELVRWRCENRMDRKLKGRNVK